MNEKAAFITIEDIIKGALRDMGESNVAMYQRYMSHAMDCANDLQFSVNKNIIGRFLSVDSATKTAKLPDDYVKYVKVGLQTANKEFVPLVPNSSLIVEPIIDPCDTVDEHCDCGCDDEVCYAMGESNVVTTFSDVVINGTTYQNSVTVCAQDSGDVIKKTCNWVVTNPQQECTYQLTITLSASALIDDPFSNVVIIKNGLNEYIGDIENVAALTTLMSSFGFALFSSNVDSIVYQKADTADVWASITYTDSSGEVHTTAFVQSACAAQTPEVAQYCYEEKVCEVEVKPCGCIAVSDTDIEVICACCNFACAVTERQRKNKDFGQTFAQPKGYFGEYKVDLYKGVIQLNSDYGYDTVYIEYYSANLVDTKNYLVPVQAKEPIIAWIYWKGLQRKRNVARWEKQDAMRTYYNEKRKMKQLLNGWNLDELMSVVRVFQRP